MKSGHRILYHCGENSSHRLLLVRTGEHCDSWRSHVYEESTGEVVYRSPSENGPAEAERAAQLGALRAGVSPILHHEERFAV